MQKFPEGTDLLKGLIVTKGGFVLRRFVIKTHLMSQNVTVNYFVEEQSRICTPNAVRAMIAQACEDFPELDPTTIRMDSQKFLLRNSDDSTAPFITIKFEVPRSSMTDELLGNTFVLDPTLLHID